MNKTYEKMINNFLAEHKQPTAEDLYTFIIDNEWRIYHEYEKMCHKEDLYVHELRVPTDCCVEHSTDGDPKVCLLRMHRFVGDFPCLGKDDR